MSENETVLSEGEVQSTTDDHEVVATSNEQANADGNPITNRKGTISSACFNLLSTMVGGGSLSLPLAFQQAGNGLLGPLILIVTALVTEFAFRVLVASAPAPNPAQRGEASFESVTKTAFGPASHVMSTVLVCSMCFFGTVGYAVLLRDMLQPISDYIWSEATPMTHNFGMLFVVFLVTPLCGLETLTSLEKYGATSMVAVLVLGTCVMVRSFQCVAETGDLRISLWPESSRMVLDAIPLFISCFVCHYNIHPVHNDLQRPSKKRVSTWLRWTTWSATSYYMVMGISGSLYAACTPDGTIKGNVLLSFDDDDPLLFVGRMCLALTITLAFPMLTIPARDIVLRSIQKQLENEEGITSDNDLEEPLLDGQETDEVEEQVGRISPSFLHRLSVAIVVFWSGAAVACCVSSIDVVWDLLGSSLSILMSYLIPFGSYLVLKNCSGENNTFSRALCWMLLGYYSPLMFVSTGNAILNVFYAQELKDEETYGMLTNILAFLH
mmetsp:Transcript_11384/g.16717  ORF Transcript_11384/g.16717 Transcript_11384/m.16717 type:complete len:496 (+) Transcript_11384:139-1626(+)